MTSNGEYPVSLLLDGPLFSDELKYQPQQSTIDEEFDTLRIIPSKSAASGVYTIYFLPKDRQWALVRLAKRYRGLFEIQLNRGMSGEYQFLRQGFNSEDLNFLFDVIPKPSKEFSPIVYDMLWLVATYDEYLALTNEMVDRDEFTPRQILQTMDNEIGDNDGFFTRFLRSHLIQPKAEDSDYRRSRSNRTKSNISLELDTVHEITVDGKEVLQGIISEHERIFERQQFNPLLINSELDPIKHIQQFKNESTKTTPEVSINEMQQEDGILGEIAKSFAPIDDAIDTPNETPQTISNEADGQTSDQESEKILKDPNQTSDPKNKLSDSQRENLTKMKNNSTNNGAFTEELMLGDFSEDEIEQASIAAANLILERSLVRTSKVKEVVWGSVDCADRSQSTLWEAVCDVLLTMDVVQGRRSGYIWLSTKYNGNE